MSARYFALDRVFCILPERRSADVALALLLVVHLGSGLLLADAVRQEERFRVPPLLGQLGCTLLSAQPSKLSGERAPPDLG